MSGPWTPADGLNLRSGDDGVEQIIEHRFCANIRCLAQATVWAEPDTDMDREFAAMGWQSFLGDHFCPEHRMRR